MMHVGNQTTFRKDGIMEKSRLGIVFIFAGVILFIVSLFVTLPIPSLYLISLFSLLISVILIAVGFAETNREEITEG